MNQEILTYEQFTDNCARVMQRLSLSCEKAGRSCDEVGLLPVTKTHSAEIAAYAHRYGFKSVGENRVQEAVDKMPLVDRSLSWELIGHLQSNKARLAVAHFSRVQSVDSLKLARRLAGAAEEEGKKLRILVQVNAGEDPAKFGIMCDEAPELFDALLAMESLSVEGLMTIAPLSEDACVARKSFERLRVLRDRLSQSHGAALPELSMGMSGDMELAIAEGSTMIRVGSALFGVRG